MQRNHAHHSPFGFRIYRKRIHLLVTFLVIALPFLFLAFVAPIAHLDRSAFLSDLAISTIRLAIAYVIALALAIICGLSLSHGRVGNFFLPVFDVLQSFPTFAMLPLVVYWFGKSDTTVIIFLVVTLIWPMLFAIISALKLVHPDWEEAATVFGATGWKRLVYFALPVAFPGVVTGSIIGLGEGWEAVVGAEIIVGFHGNGLGSFFNQHGTSTGVVLFGVTALLLFIFSLNKLVWLPLLEQSHKRLTD